VAETQTGAEVSTGQASTPEATAATVQSRLPKELPSEGGGQEKTRLFEIGDGVKYAKYAIYYRRLRDDPLYRPLKIYTTDPSAPRLEGAAAVINVPYEPLDPGPTGKRFLIKQAKKSPLGEYPDVDLEQKRVLIRNGYDPAPSDPAFHHQMVYAVCTSVYAVFRAALGRELAWGFDSQQLTVFPHGMLESNAMYSKEDSNLRFGWYHADENVTGKLPPKGRVFACLSHDIITHELTHALLDGLRAEFSRTVSRDTAAFHEGFADIVALFQRFSYKEVVKTAIRCCAGRLEDAKFLHQLANEFSQGIGLSGGIRSVDVSDRPKTYCTECEIHELGSVLVSAIFEAFLTVYKRRSAQYFRLASNGTGILPEGLPPPDLVEILAHLLSRLASQFLSICIRAIDYCPPVNIMFGEYLRALITADFDLVPDDPWAYREALIEAFGRRRIYPPNVMALSEDVLLWLGPKKSMKVKGLDYASVKFSGDPGAPARQRNLQKQAAALGDFVLDPAKSSRLGEFGLAANGDKELGGDTVDLPCIQSVRTTRRVGPDGQMIFDLVAEVTQRRIVKRDGDPDFEFYGGSTIILDATGDVRYIIRKSVLDNEQLKQQREYWLKNKFEGYSWQHCLLARQHKPANGKQKEAVGTVARFGSAPVKIGNE
jgi:hypothetical protein